jgi:hypothetical protein
MHKKYCADLKLKQDMIDINNEKNKQKEEGEKGEKSEAA